MSNLYIDAGPPAVRQKVMLATPVYDTPAASYVFSIAQSREALTAAGIDSAYLLLAGNVHVDDSRNGVVREFLNSDCTDLIFLDADVSWEPEALIALCKFDCDLVGGVYPYRRPNTQGAMPVRMIEGIHEPVDGLLEVEGVPTGFMRIRRVVLETLAAKAKKFKPRPTESETPLIFERGLKGIDRFGGDLRFCEMWRDCGGKVFAATELRLGHAAKMVLTDSLGAYIRRAKDETLKHICGLIRERKEHTGVYREALDYVGNPYAASEDVLASSVILARGADGPILEIGSGLTTILMAAATDQRVYCVEHSKDYAESMARMARQAGVVNIGICIAPLVDGWHDPREFDGLPEKFALALVDGPPRAISKRMRFFDLMADKCGTIICDDTDDQGYFDAVSRWAEDHNRQVNRVEFRSTIIGPAPVAPEITIHEDSALAPKVELVFREAAE